MFRALVPLLLAGFMSLNAPALAQDPTEILLRLDRLESENRRLTGDVEKMQFQIPRLAQQLKKAQADNDLRLSDLEGGTAPSAPKTPKKPTQQAEDPAAADQPLPDASEDPPARPADPKPRTSGSASADFELANGLLDSDNLPDAELAFRGFLKSYPKDKLAPEAMFGLGESLYRRERYADAAEHYLNLTNQFPKAQRAPEALLKLGMSLNALGARVEACSTYDEVLKKYPKADSDVRQAVRRQRSAAECK
jgi:tol-pal system protein YbgF